MSEDVGPKSSPKSLPKPIPKSPGQDLAESPASTALHHLAAFLDRRRGKDEKKRRAEQQLKEVAILAYKKQA